MYFYTKANSWCTHNSYLLMADIATVIIKYYVLITILLNELLRKVFQAYIKYLILLLIIS